MCNYKWHKKSINAIIYLIQNASFQHVLVFFHFFVCTSFFNQSFICLFIFLLKHSLEEILLFATNPLITKCNWLSLVIPTIAYAITFEF